MKQTRIKVNPRTGQVVAWEPERTPKAPWFSIYAPDKQPGDAGQFLFTDEDVKDWPDWMPVTSREYSYFARDLVPGLMIVDKGSLLEVAANQEDGTVNRIDLVGRREPLITDRHSTARVIVADMREL